MLSVLLQTVGITAFWGILGDSVRRTIGVPPVLDHRSGQYATRRNNKYD